MENRRARARYCGERIGDHHIRPRGRLCSPARRSKEPRHERKSASHPCARRRALRQKRLCGKSHRHASVALDLYCDGGNSSTRKCARASTRIAQDAARIGAPSKRRRRSSKRFATRQSISPLLIDCLTLWLSNRLLGGADLSTRSRRACSCVVVPLGADRRRLVRSWIVHRAGQCAGAFFSRCGRRIASGCFADCGTGSSSSSQAIR